VSSRGLLWLVATIFLLSGCAKPTASVPTPTRTREQAIPQDARKITPETDIYPPKLHSNEWRAPVPLPRAINTAGGEDSGFILPDGNTLYVWFTPDVSVPAEKQLFDGVTGIYIARQVNGKWGEPQRVVLQDAGKLALDGCEFAQDNIIWFCSAREGFTGINLFTAEFKNGKWTNWRYAGDTLNKKYQAGEMHITADGSEMYFHSARAGGKGQSDIWLTRLANGEWQPPENVEAVNSIETDGWPFVTVDGKELWFTRIFQGSPAIYRSKKLNTKWSAPELILSQFAGEPSVDTAGNIYFTHHFFKDSKMLEADIYVAYRK
jgi:hypothetical protein